MFKRILIANRGEIACRVTDTCRRLGVRTVAVHSDIDALARHVVMADQAVSLGGATPAESYLRADAVIQAALATGAEAIHPGYGFLSENADFAQAVADAGLIFIGPSPEAIRAMGLKDAAKVRMAEAGVPVVPGYQGADQSLARLAEEAAKIGYPVLIKAVAGGGGKGMRRVEAPDDFDAALRAAQGEAEAAFGNRNVLIEKWIDTPRHIEVQIFGDGQRAVHLFERDCSLQRRHQKVIEEAPAPGMTEEMRAAMGAAAVRAAEAIGYAGAGTVEFIVDASDGLKPDGFWFMEMNTRLQVEHPVTEAITGIDLVEWQLKVAAGAPLPCTQEALSIHGHAFEARIYAEDVPAGFLPATGRLSHLRFAEMARIETGVRGGDEISPYYDPMIAKLVVHGENRTHALGALERALSETQVAGTVTNLGFLRALTRHDGFAAGVVDTGLIDRDLAALSAVPAPCTRSRALAAVAAAGPNAGGFTLWAPLRRQARFDPMIWVTTLGSENWRVQVDDTEHLIARRAGKWIVDEEMVAAETHLGDTAVHVFWGNTYQFDLPDPLDVGNTSAEVPGAITAPMPGLVKEITVTEGDRVEKGQTLAVLEAMKMEHSLQAPGSARVVSVSVEAGAQVAIGALLIQLDPET